MQGKEPLARQVADFLLRGRETLPIDLADTQVWVPTAGAARRIRQALANVAAERGTGVLSPAFLQPLQALLETSAEGPPVATRSEREAAWVMVLRTADAEEWDELLPDPTILEGASGALGVGGMLCDLCDLLAEGGLHPAHPLVEKICTEDLGRWKQLQPLYRAYRQRLAADDLADPNEVRLAALARAQPLEGIRRVVVACIPDLVEVAARVLGAWARKGVEIFVLVWQPGEMPAGWDEWGRPLPEEWAACVLPVESSQIAVARQADEESSRVLNFLSAAETPGDYALALADETLGASLAGEITRRGGLPFQPEGRPLAGEEAAKITLEWEHWQASGDLRVLRNLLQWPHFHRWLGRTTGLLPAQMLSACDFLIAGPLAETLGQAREYLEEMEIPAERPNPAAEWARALVAGLLQVARISFSELLEAAWEHSPDGAEAAGRVLELWQELSESVLFAHWSGGRLPALSRALRAERIFDAAPEDSVELSGWLETPWLEAERVAVCGCVEGRLPTSVGEHPFLPDSKRSALGLQDNARRLARDAYLLMCLLLTYAPGNLLLSMSRFDAEGSPTLPSRLLLRTNEIALPERVLLVFAPVPSTRSQPPRVNGWRWKLPEGLRRPSADKISPTQCKDYLTCPTRFYLKNVLRLDSYDADPREMDARRFGTLLHRAVENFARRAPNEAKAQVIEEIVLEEFMAEARRMFGPSPTAAVRVQMESGQVRLRAFARVQAAEYAAGWRILEVEKRISPDMEAPLKIGPLNLSAQVDRIEIHPELGLRIMDYKTFSEPKLPEKTHFGPAQPEHFLPESQVELNGKSKSWTDLQLPLYRLIASQLYKTTNIQTSYFLLTADPAETQVAPLELDDTTYASALACAAAIASRIDRRVFWPPQAHGNQWQDAYAPWFLNGSPENCLDAETITFLKGRE